MRTGGGLGRLIVLIARFLDDYFPFIVFQDRLEANYE